MLAASWKEPVLVAPSPKLTTVTRSSPLRLADIARPTATGGPAPTIPVDSITPFSGLRDVHGAALAAAGADDAAHHLAVDLFERHTLADQIVQPAVGGDQLVVGAQRDTHRGGDRLLAARRPVHAHELPGADALGQPVVGGLHQHHQRIEPPLDVRGTSTAESLCVGTDLPVHLGNWWGLHVEQLQRGHLAAGAELAQLLHHAVEVVAVELVDGDERTVAVASARSGGPR